MSILAQTSGLVLDARDPAALADFYQKAAGWEVTSSGPDGASLTGGPLPVTLQRVEDYRTPPWPGSAAAIHLDFVVADVDQAVDALVALGATKPDTQPGGSGWTVLTDPEGHPFCIMTG